MGPFTMNIAVTPLLLLGVAVSLGSAATNLEQLIVDTIHEFNTTAELTAQLQKILGLSQGLLALRTGVNQVAQTAQLIGQLQTESNGSTVQLLQTARMITDLAARFTTNDPVVAILARRAVFAGVVLHWVSLGHITSQNDHERLLADIVMKSYETHATIISRKGLMEYFHISKSGGTSFSLAAKLSACDMPAGIGQLESLGDLPRWINGTAFEIITGGVDIMWSYYDSGRKGSIVGCRERFDHAASQGFNYISNEYTLHGGQSDPAATHVCPHVVNVVTLRSPESRLMSHLHYMLGRIKRRLSGKDDMDAFKQVFCVNNRSAWEAVAPGVLDNYMTRSFTGERAFHMPVGGLQPQHLEIARRLLIQFDLVLDLGAGDELANSVMEQGLGWNVTLAEVHARSASTASKKTNYSREECSNEELLSEVLPQQTADRQLYSTGRVLSLLDSLLLGMAQQLKLPATVSSSPPAGNRHCGLLSWPTREVARRRFQRHRNNRKR